MAQLLIRQAHGGETRTIDDGTWPYFANQGYVIIDTLDDSTDPSPYTLTAEESDFRYVQTGNIGDAGSADGMELRVFFEERIDRTAAVAGDVPVLQADGTLALEASGGGGSGTVTTVNDVAPVSGNVTLTADDLDDGTTYVRLTAAQREQLELLLAHGVVILQHEGGSDPARYATSMHVIFDAPDANRPATSGTTSGGDYAAVEGHDYIWTR